MPKLCVIPGDGIGQEVIPVAVAVLTAVIPNLDIVQAEAGWGTFEKRGALLARYVWGLEGAAKRIETAVETSLADKTFTTLKTSKRISQLILANL